MLEKQHESSAGVARNAPAQSRGESGTKEKPAIDVAKTAPVGRRKLSPNFKAVGSAGNTTSVVGNPVKGKTIETRPISGLKPHPNQASLFHDLKGKTFERLKASMKERGLDQPIEVLPDGTILDGHERWHAAMQLDWTEVEVRIRSDLVGNRQAIGLRHGTANGERRQLSPLDRARVAKHTLEIKAGKESGGSGNRDIAGLRDFISEELGCSSRHATRMILLLSLPMTIQRAVDEGSLPVAVGAKVAGLAVQVQEMIGRDIEEGGIPAKVVAPHLAASKRGRLSVDRAFAEFERAIDRVLDCLGGREAEVSCIDPDASDQIAKWKRAKQLVDNLNGRLGVLKKQDKRKQNDRVKRVKKLANPGR